MFNLESIKQVLQAMQEKNKAMRENARKGIIPAVKEYQEHWNAVIEFEGLLMELKLTTEFYPMFLAEYTEDIALLEAQAKELADDTDLLALELDKYAEEATA